MSVTDMLDKWNDCVEHSSVPADSAIVKGLLERPGCTAAHDVLMPVRSLLLRSIGVFQ
jgi:hypothetical protein